MNECGNYVNNRIMNLSKSELPGLVDCDVRITHDRELLSTPRPDIILPPPDTLRPSTRQRHPKTDIPFPVSES